jgi:TPR repeat protein
MQVPPLLHFGQAGKLLGVMYANGQGAPQGHVQAHKWFNIAGTYGDKNGYKSRDIVARKMTPVPDRRSTEAGP